jgi:hypothetical protein
VFEVFGVFEAFEAFDVFELFEAFAVFDASGVRAPVAPRVAHAICPREGPARWRGLGHVSLRA